MSVEHVTCCDRCGTLGSAEEYNTNAWVEMTLFPEGDEDSRVVLHLCPSCNDALHNGFLRNVERIAVSVPNRILGIGERS